MSAAQRPGSFGRRIGMLGIVVCGAIVAVVAAVAILGSAVAPHSAGAQDVGNILAGPSGAHWLGTDSLGRDVASRLIVGARSAFVGPLLIAIGSMLIGNALGLLAGYRGGRLDAILMRWVDLMWSVPALLVIIVVLGVLGTSYWAAVGLLTILTVPFDARVVRGATLEQAPRPYVQAARTLGISDTRIMFFHIWPNVAAVAIANTFLVFAASLTAMAGLSFLGFGLAPGSPDWGLMLAEGFQDLFQNPLAILAPGVAIVLAATSINLIGDWLYERLSSRGASR
ncbi:ABC transporter permease [Conexibacter stalactiti]|uniref:ABC transporter permease n=1 Tax=Conexibacter stalactiti TaxID=1940611 RepID=A0ABU4HP14_9ACTN|nr:ABC transporter permease [Conexibacter stalactiti]MDW5595056.1 ABC transporter permease [Conexibacter stalactiti]MEC5035698.1 ABC transporter permease [Conexibacter stalactiti]